MSIYYVFVKVYCIAAVTMITRMTNMTILVQMLIDKELIG